MRNGDFNAVRAEMLYVRVETAGHSETQRKEIVAVGSRYQKTGEDRD
jgi:hypothetical protein